MTDLARRVALVEQAGRAGAEEAFEHFRTGVTVETKATKNDLVTEADRAAQQAAIEPIRSAYPDDPIVAEENDDGRTLPETGPAWVIDPIDGTANYVRGLRLWTTSVAAVLDGEPVGAASVMPAMDDVYTATHEESYLNGDRTRVSECEDPERFAVAVLGWGPAADRSAYAALANTVIDRFGDMRRLGSMQAALAFVAAGQLDAAITTRRPNTWDSLAGAHLIANAGGTVTDADGRPWRHDSPAMVVSNGRAHETVLDAARDSQR